MNICLVILLIFCVISGFEKDPYNELKEAYETFIVFGICGMSKYQKELLRKEHRRLFKEGEQ